MMVKPMNRYIEGERMKEINIHPYLWKLRVKTVKIDSNRKGVRVFFFVEYDKKTNT